MADNENDGLSKLLADSQAGFEQQVKSLIGGEPSLPHEDKKNAEASPAISDPQSPFAGAPLKSAEGRDKRVWSSHPRSGMR